MSIINATSKFFVVAFIMLINVLMPAIYLYEQNKHHAQLIFLGRVRGRFVVLLPGKQIWSCQIGKTESPLLAVAKVPASGQTGISLLM